MSVRLSARGLGVNPFFSRLARIKRSIGDAHHALFLTAGSAGSFTGRNAQCFRAASVITYSPVCAARTAASEALSAGQGAPIFTQVARASISPGVSLPAGGILI